ncbi:hypothetical protein, partial [Dickeya dianthicola]|uniref:hypothetical protein n=1 Tax=Dickeya dianthicola TaxID=204039 RepID=UPI001EE64332
FYVVAPFFNVNRVWRWPGINDNNSWVLCVCCFINLPLSSHYFIYEENEYDGARLIVCLVIKIKQPSRVFFYSVALRIISVALRIIAGGGRKPADTDITGEFSLLGLGLSYA